MPAQTMNGKRILIVEDEIIIAMGTARFLEGEGYLVSIVGSGEDAVRLALEQNISLVLMDIDLGKGIDGAQAAAAILAQRDIPILFNSSHCEPEIVHKVEAISSYGYVVKSAGSTVLAASIRMAFRLHEARLKIEAKNVEIECANEELRQAEEDLVESSNSLAESEKRFRLLVENSLVAIFIQMGGKFSYCNASAVELFGASDESQLLGMPVVDRFTPAFREIVAQRIQQLNENKQVMLPLREDILRLDGTFVSAEIYAVPITFPAGNGALVYMTDLTARDETERLIREKDDLLSQMSAIAHIGGWQFDPRTGKGSWTEEVARIHDVDPSDQTSKDFGVSFFESESREKIEEAIKDAIEKGTPYDLELQIISANGRRKWIRTISNVSRENGITTKISGTIQDISDLKRAELQLQKKNSEYSIIVENISDCILRYDSECRIVYANSSAIRFFSCGGDDYEGKRHSELGFPHKICEMIEEEIRKVSESRFPSTLIFELETSAGSQWAEMKFCPEKGGSGVIAIARDITERKMIEKETEQLSQQFQKMFMDHMGVMLLISPDDGRIIAANIAASQYYGYHLHLLTSMNISDLNRLSEEEIKKEMHEAKEARRNYFIFPHHLSSGEIRTVEVYSSPIIIRNSTLLFSIIHDVTEREQTKAELEDLLGEKEILFKELQHRVKNSLSLVSGLLTLEIDDIDPARAKEILLSARSRISTISGIYERLCQSSNVDRINLSSYVTQFVDSLYQSYVIDVNRILFESSIEALVLDMKRAVPLCLILNELVTNALKYAFPDSRRGVICIVIRNENGELALNVSDDGAGKDGLYDPESSSSMGSRLVHLLTIQLNGTISASSAAEKGTSVEVRFPL